MKTERVLGAMPLIPKLYMDCNVKRNLIETRIKNVRENISHFW
jgi:hypothetical protein